MRIVVTGATGNVGTSVLEALGRDDAVDQVTGLARRVPSTAYPKTTWRQADVTSSDLVPVFDGADVVIHLAWSIQPSHDLEALLRTNVLGSQRVFDAVAAATVPALVIASSVGAYSKGPKEGAVSEDWPTEGTPTSFYARHKAEVERRLDRFEQDHPNVRVVRLRPALSFKREAAEEVRRLFVGPLVPAWLLRPALIPVVPSIPGLRFQAVHSSDVGEAYRLAAIRDVRGAFNIAADPVLDIAEIGKLLRARPIRVPAWMLRALIRLTWRLHLQPTEPGWFDMAVRAPLMDWTRAGRELGWSPTHDAREALAQLLAGFSRRASTATPPLSRHRRRRRGSR
jgi:nucleoside-diphosphate-sugar epimerase